jgi:hypothetical protein
MEAGRALDMSAFSAASMAPSEKAVCTSTTLPTTAMGLVSHGFLAQQV